MQESKSSNIQDYLNKIINGDCLDVMRSMPDNCVDLVVTSPPYNKGYYDNRTIAPESKNVWKQRTITYQNTPDDLVPEEYENQQRLLLQELVRLLKPGGSIFYNHKSFSYKHKLVFPKWVFDFNLRQMIIWDRGSTPQINPIRFYPTTEYIFWITKTNEQPKFNNKDIGFKNEVWRINALPQPNHPAPFPEELVRNCILSASDKGDIILDPYCGSGTVPKISQEQGRNFIGIEISLEYCDIAERRLKQQVLQI